MASPKVPPKTVRTQATIGPTITKPPADPNPAPQAKPGTEAKPAAKQSWLKPAQWPESKKAAPADAASALKQMNALNDRAKNTGTVGSWVSSVLTRGSHGEARKTVDDLVQSVNKTYNTLTKGGTQALTPAQEQTMRKLIDGAVSSINDVAGVRKNVVDIVQDSGTAMLATAAAPLTGGTSLLAIGGGAAVGAGASVALRGTMDGKGYSVKQAGRDVLSGAVEGGAAAAAELAGSTAVVSKLAKAAGSAVSRGAGEVAGRFVTGAVHGAVRGGLNGAATGAVDATKKPETWDQGVAKGVKHVATQSLKSGAGGALMAGLVGGGLNTVVAGAFAAEPKVELKSAMAHADEGTNRTTLLNVEHLLTQTRTIADGAARRAAQEKILLSAQLKTTVLKALREHVGDFNVNLDAAWGVLGAGSGSEK
jgi:hypothetical protein